MTKTETYMSYLEGIVGYACRFVFLAACVVTSQCRNCGRRSASFEKGTSRNRGNFLTGNE